MTFCRNCGVEISYKRTKNEKWLPCDFLTGKPHICDKSKKQTGISTCNICGKPIFKMKGKYVDYSTLKIHVCNKADITRYSKYKKKIVLLKKLNV